VNHGPDDATNLVGTVQVPAHTHFVSFSAPAGLGDNAPAAGTEGPFTITAPAAAAPAGVGPQAFTLVVQVDADAPDGTVVTSSTHVASDTGDPDPENNSGSASASVVVAAPPSATLTLSKTGPASATVGDTLTYTLTVANTGPDADTNVLLSDPLPAGAAFVSDATSQGSLSVADNTVLADLGTLAPGATATITIVVRATSVGSLVNTATVHGDLAGPGGNKAASASRPTQVNPVPPAPMANLTLGNTAPASATAGGNFAYTLTVGNTGPDADSGVVLTDTLPANVRVIALEASQGTIVLGAGNTVTANLGAIGVGATVTVTIMVQAVVEGSLVNMAIARSDLASVASASAQTQVSAAPSAASPPPLTGAAPRVMAVRRSGFHARPTVLTLSFSGDLDPIRAQDLDAYQIVVPGLGHVALSSASYNALTHTVTLRPSARINIHHPFALTVVGTGARGLADTSGRLLDGARTGQAGHDFTATIVGFGPGPLPTAAAALALARPRLRAQAGAHRRG
jgi:uncharacterized repeat protein (TIGR01451 family)